MRPIRRAVQLLFLGFSVFLVVKAAYPPIAVPPSNLFLRSDPLAGILSLSAGGSGSVFLGYWPAWILLGFTLLSSRFFCGWMCPLGTCFDLAGAVKPKFLRYYRPKGDRMKELAGERRAGIRPRRIRVKYFILLLVAAVSFAGVNLLYFFSPSVIFNRSLYFILVPGVPVFFILLVLLALLYRPRFWCEEICPLGALLGLCSRAGRRLPVRLSPLTVVKDADACISCGACYLNCPFGVEEPFTKPGSGRLTSADCTACGDCVAACPAEGALELNGFGRTLSRSRGATIPGRAVHVPSTETPRAAQATDTRLTVTRKEFVASLGAGAVLLAGYGLGLRDMEEPVLRMPGAQDESAFLAACNRCGECTRACPTGCILPMGLEGGFQKLWTPRFNPRSACCMFDRCDQACARVCPAGAIDFLKPEEVRIGTAFIDRRKCLAWRGGICLACKERCRFDAIEVDPGRRPLVNQENCTGCGACQQTCPTEPASIQVFPADHAVSRPSEGSGGGGQRRRGGR